MASLRRGAQESTALAQGHVGGCCLPWLGGPFHLGALGSTGNRDPLPASPRQIALALYSGSATLSECDLGHVTFPPVTCLLVSSGLCRSSPVASYQGRDGGAGTRVLRVKLSWIQDDLCTGPLVVSLPSFAFLHPRG